MLAVMVGYGGFQRFFSEFQMISASFQMISAKIRMISGGQNHSELPFSRGFCIFGGGYTPLFFGKCKTLWKSRCFHAWA